jgi:hypothetical protein
MREANFAFPAQNRACVCITSQLYDRRGMLHDFLSSIDNLTHEFLRSAGHDILTTAVQLAYPSHVSNVNLSKNPRNHDHGWRP